MVSQELCLALHTHDLIRPFHLRLGEIAAVIPGVRESVLVQGGAGG